MSLKTPGLASQLAIWSAQEAAPPGGLHGQPDGQYPQSYQFSRTPLASRIPPHYSAARLLPIHPNSSQEGCGVRTTSQVFRLSLFMKRIMDVSLSFVALLSLSPLMLLIALAIKLQSHGPAIYPAARAGRNGRKFSCFKFRTMIDSADELKGGLRTANQRQGPFFKIAGDPRVTRLGRLLRKYSLDELPQFWNVLKGDMTLVGPRPHPLDDVALYRQEDHSRLEVKPGLTGLWQVTARTNPSFATCLALDLAYIRQWSLLLDCRILLKTVPEVLSGTGE